jgi:hypothetical protein
MLQSTYDYIVTICYVWLIMVGFFIAITIEMLLLIGLVFPILIIVILNRDRKISKITK